MAGGSDFGGSSGGGEDATNATQSILVNLNNMTNATQSILVNETDMTNATQSVLVNLNNMTNATQSALVNLNNMTNATQSILVTEADMTNATQSILVTEAKLDSLDSGSNAPWFEWNGIDLTQFDSHILGDDIEQATSSVLAYSGDNWLRLKITYIAGDTGQAGIILLPITATPPSPDYTIEAEIYLKTQQGSTIGPGLMVRFDGTDTFYAYSIISSTSRHGEWYHHTSITSGNGAAIMGSGTSIDVKGLAVGLSTVLKGGGKGRNCANSEISARTFSWYTIYYHSYYSSGPGRVVFDFSWGRKYWHDGNSHA